MTAFTIAPIGTCRIHTPLRDAVAKGDAAKRDRSIDELDVGVRECYSDVRELLVHFRTRTSEEDIEAALRATLSAATGAATRISSREEAGAAGAAMIAATAIGVYPSLPDCIAQWVTPNLGPAEAPDTALAALYAQRFPLYRAARLAPTTRSSRSTASSALPVTASSHRKMMRRSAKCRQK